MAFPEPKPRGPELPQKRLKTLDCGQGAVRAVRFNADGNYCLTCGSDKTLKLWNPLRGTLLRTYSGHGYEVLDAAGSFDNSSLCSGGGDKAVVLWDVASGQAVRKFRGHAGRPLSSCLVQLILAFAAGTAALGGLSQCRHWMKPGMAYLV